MPYERFLSQNQMKNPHAVALGKLGGKVKSDRKTEAARKNGKKGGRPRKYLKVMAETHIDGYRNREDIVMRHKRTGKLYRILSRYDQVGQDVARPRAACQLIVSVNPRVYSQDGRTDRTFYLENLEPAHD
jgi:hypothetical protein